MAKTITSMCISSNLQLWKAAFLSGLQRRADASQMAKVALRAVENFENELALAEKLYGLDQALVSKGEKASSSSNTTAAAVEIFSDDETS